METELYRLSTYQNFPMDSPVHPIRLAEAGFYYQGKQDEVTCFKCNFQHVNWTTDQDPFKIHSSMSSGCPFIKQHPKTDFTKGHDILNSEGDLTLNIGACGDPKDMHKVSKTNSESAFLDNGSECHENILTNIVHTCSVNTETADLNQHTNHNTENGITITSHPCSQPSPQLEALHQTALPSYNQTMPNSIGITTARPKYQSFAIQSVRHASFKNWPSFLKQEPAELAKAGLFYEGEIL